MYAVKRSDTGTHSVSQTFAGSSDQQKESILMYVVKRSDTVTHSVSQTFPERVVINKVMDPPTHVYRGRETFLNSPTVDCQTCDALNTNTN